MNDPSNIGFDPTSAEADKTLLIDTHVHIWTLGENDCTWPTPHEPAIFRNYTLDDLNNQSGDVLSGIVLVQSQPSLADTHMLLRTAKETDKVRAVCGWCDLSARDAADQVEQLGSEDYLVALRPMVQNLPSGWLANAGIEEGVRAMASNELIFEGLVREHQLKELVDFKRSFPGLMMILDHAGKPQLGGDLDAWKSNISDLADEPHTYCKLSGLMTECLPGTAISDYRHVVSHLLDTFGPDRMIWGSDWPVVNMAGSYGEWLTLSNTLLSELTHEERRKIYSGNALHVYRIDERG